MTIAAVRGSMVEAAMDAFGRSMHPLDVVTGAMLAAMLEASTSHTERAEALARVRGARRLQAQAVAFEQAALLDVAGLAESVEATEADGRTIVVRDASVAEIALTTAQSEAAVRRSLAVARGLAQSLPQAKQALADGQLDPAKAAMLAHAANRVPAEMRPALESQLLEPARTLHARDFHIAAEQAVRGLDPEGAERRRLMAMRRRAVWVGPDEDGHSILSARLASGDAHRCLRSIEDAVRSRRDAVNAAHDAADLERPNLGMLHAEELVARLVTEVRTESDLPPGVRVVTEVQIQVDLHTLAGLQEKPGLLDGVTPLCLSELREWLADSGDVRFRRLITDPETGRVLDAGSRTYSPPASLRRFIVARDGRCIWPGCGTPAIDCDIDHALPWESGGRTDSDNLNALCRSHHLLKTLAGYRLVRAGGGGWQFVTPTGEFFEASTIHPPDG